MASEAEEKFFAAWLESPMPGSRLVREYKFCPDRNWRLDFALIADELDTSLPRYAIEIQGFGRHHTFMGAAGDMEKARALVALGWRLIPLPAHAVVRDPAAAVEEVQGIICGHLPEETCLI